MDTNTIVWVTCFSLVAFVFYWLPTAVAFGRNQPNKAQILLTNLLVGWTVIGWIVALIWSAKPRTEK